MAQYADIAPTVAQVQTLGQLLVAADKTLNSRLDIQITASTDADADYAAEVADGRVNSDGQIKGSLGANIRDGQLDSALALSSEKIHRLDDDDCLQRQIDSLSEAVLEILAIISENREILTGGL